jgi:cytochrome c biogenesis protein CcmG/thiol:disulfide interchange protein DsbE
MTTRKRLAVLLALAAAAVVIWGGLRTLAMNEKPAGGVGAEAPDFKAVTLAEPPVTKSLSDYRGDVVLLNVWATWCGPCRVEMPSIEQLHRSYAPKGLKVIAVSVDEPGMAPQIRSFVKEYGLTFEVLHDPEGQLGELSRKYQTSGYPETVVVGRDGIIRRRLLGATDWNSDDNRALIERLLSEKAE